MNQPDPTANDHQEGSDVRNLRSELEVARERLEWALIGGNIGLWDWNPATSEVFYSDTFKSQLGYPPDVQWNSFDEWESRLHPDDQANALATVQAYFNRTSDEYKSVFRLKCHDDSYRWFLAQGKGVFDDQGQPTRMTGIHVDITEQVRADRELQRVNEEIANVNEALQASNVELQQFAYVASHDLQTPLRAIGGFAQFLRKDYATELDERANRYIDRIVVGVKRMQTMINDLLMYSRVESQAAEFEKVSLDAILNNTQELLESSIEECGGDVILEPLPTVYGDAAQLSQLFINLIGNALKYNKSKPRVEVWAESEPHRVRVCVQDNGIGIDEQDYDRIFEVFRRLHPQDAFPGTGIGLAICRRIIQRHGWQISVEPNPAGGTRFWITIARV